MLIFWWVDTICSCASALFISTVQLGYCFAFILISFCLYSFMTIFSACPYPTPSTRTTCFSSTILSTSIFLWFTASTHFTFAIWSTFSTCHCCSLTIWCTTIDRSAICCTSMLILCYLSSSADNMRYTFLTIRSTPLVDCSYSSRLSISLPALSHSRLFMIAMILMPWILIFYSPVNTRTH